MLKQKFVISKYLFLKHNLSFAIYAWINIELDEFQ